MNGPGWNAAVLATFSSLPARANLRQEQLREMSQGRDVYLNHLRLVRPFRPLKCAGSTESRIVDQNVEHHA
jgi:hypothetical protein